MRNLVIGRGHLGRYVARKLGVPPDMHWLDSIDSLTKEKLRELSPDVVINTAGKTDLAWCEANPHETFASNTISPINLQRRLMDLGIQFVHISSGCVWDGPYKANGDAFQPNDPVSPACHYSWTKAVCDSILVQESDSVLIIRPRQVYSDVCSPRNTLEKLRVYKNLLDTPNSMTSADTIVKTITTMLERSQDVNTKARPKIMNVYDRGVSSPYEVATFLYEAGLREQPGLLDKSSLDKWHKPRRVDAVIFDSAFERFIDPPFVQDELKRVIGEFKRNA